MKTRRPSPRNLILFQSAECLHCSKIRYSGAQCPDFLNIKMHGIRLDSSGHCPGRSAPKTTATANNLQQTIQIE